MDSPPPVRFRVVVELTLPDADPWDPSDYDQFLEQVKEALESAPTVNCKHVLIREAVTIGPQDNYDDWRGGWKCDFSSLGPDLGHIFGVTYPVAAVDPTDLARVWEVMSRAEAGELKHANVAVAIGQVLRPESDAHATIARVSMLRALQTKNAVPAGASRAIFGKAASFPFERPIERASDMDSLAHIFGDQSF
jgi:hypothetical protein